MSSQTFDIDSDGKASWLNDDVGPTQSQLQEFLTNNREKLTELDISVQHGEEQPILNFETIGTLPSLKSLNLGGVFVEAISFTTSNTPVLESLSIELLSCKHEDGLRFELALPLLKSFTAEHVMVDGVCDFGVSLSRCPLLERVYTYKFRYLRGDNFAILPNCEELTLYRSECTDSIEVLSAPKLTLLSVHSSYSLKHMRLWDLPNDVSVQDAERLSSELLDASKKIAQELDIWAKKWKDGTFTGKDAYDRNWIEWEEIDGFDFKTRPYMEEVLFDDLDRMYEERRQMAKERIWKAFVTTIATRPLVNRKDSLPLCEVNCVNLTLSKSSRDHLIANKRVKLVGGGDDDDDDDMLGQLCGM